MSDIEIMIIYNAFSTMISSIIKRSKKRKISTTNIRYIYRRLEKIESRDARQAREIFHGVSCE